MLGIEFRSGTSTEPLLHARLWASECDLDVTPALRGFTGQCLQLTGKQMTLAECLRVSTDSGEGLPGRHLPAVVILGKPLYFPGPGVFICTMG